MTIKQLWQCLPRFCFLPQEFLLRIYAVLRRCYKEDAPVLRPDSCTVYFSRAEVDKGGETLWSGNPFGYENSLNAHVRRRADIKQL